MKKNKFFSSFKNVKNRIELMWKSHRIKKLMRKSHRIKQNDAKIASQN